GMGRDAMPGDGNSLGQLLRAPLRRPSISQNRAATIRRHSVLPHLREIRVPTTAEIQACYLARRYCASTLCHWMAQVDDGKRVSSVASLAIGRRSNLPALLQRLADLSLGELFLLRNIFITRLAVLCDKRSRFNVLRFPIEIEHLVVRPQIILGVPMAIQAPRHAGRFSDAYRRHVIDRAMATKAADTSVHVR